MHILWIILIGFIAGVVAKLVTPGENQPQGFLLTTILGIVGAFVTTYIGHGIARTRMPGLFELSSAQCSYW